MHPTSFRDLLAHVDAAYRTVAAFRCAPNSSAAEIIWGERMLKRR
jgi:hypothetical protein